MRVMGLGKSLSIRGLFASSVLIVLSFKASPNVHFCVIPGVTHFSILAPANRRIADKILGDSGATSNIQFTDQDLDGISRKEQ
jgi:hypothetical protein